MSDRRLTFRGVNAVWSRHFWLYRKTFIVNCIAPISEPVIYLLAFGLGLSPLIKTVQLSGISVEYLKFLAPGMIAVAVLFQSFFEGAYGTFIRITFQQTWAAQLATPLTFNEIFVGDWLWAATKGIIAGTITGLVAVIWGAIPLISLISHLPVIFLGSVIFAALGLTTAGWVRTVDQINLPVFLFVVPMFTLCGTYFPREGLPLPLRAISAMLPLSPLIDLLRSHLNVPTPLFTDVIVLLGWLIGLGMLSFRLLTKKVFR